MRIGDYISLWVLETIHLFQTCPKVLLQSMLSSTFSRVVTMAEIQFSSEDRAMRSFICMVLWLFIATAHGSWTVKKGGALRTQFGINFFSCEFYYSGTRTLWCVISLVLKITLNTPCASFHQCFTDCKMLQFMATVALASIHRGAQPLDPLPRGWICLAPGHKAVHPSSSCLILLNQLTVFSQMEVKSVLHCIVYPVVCWLDMKTQFQRILKQSMQGWMG